MLKVISTPTAVTFSPYSTDIVQPVIMSTAPAALIMQFDDVTLYTNDRHMSLAEHLTAHDRMLGVGSVSRTRPYAVGQML